MTPWFRGPMRNARMSQRCVFVAASVLLLVMIGASDVQAQDFDIGRLLDRIDRLERDIRTLNLQIARGAPAPAGTAPATGALGAAGVEAAAPMTETAIPAITRLEQRFSELEGDIRAVTGQQEAVAYRLDDSNRRVDEIGVRLDKLVGDVDFRLGRIESAVAAARASASGPMPIAAVPRPPSVESAAALPGSEGFATRPGNLGSIPLSALTPGEPAGSSAPPAETASVHPEGSPSERYDYARSLLVQNRFGEAERALRAFLAAHPDHQLAANAQYWLGETHYVRRDYQTAAQVFMESYQKYKNGPKAPDSLLKLGMALANEDRQREACITFAELDKAFPDAPAYIKDSALRQKERSGCN
jgi:tol-pal system protein YbgF